MSEDIIKFPKAAIQDRNGQLNAAGRSVLERVVERVKLPPADTTQRLLAGGKGQVTADAVWGAMVPVPTTGGGDWQPDMSQVMDFVRTLSGPSTVLFPNLAMDSALPYFSILVIQDSLGGHSLAWGAGFEGAYPVINTAANDKTLVGGKILTRNPDTFTAWTVKGMMAS